MMLLHLLKASKLKMNDVFNKMIFYALRLSSASLKLPMTFGSDCRHHRLCALIVACYQPFGEIAVHYLAWRCRPGCVRRNRGFGEAVRGELKAVSQKRYCCT